MSSPREVLFLTATNTITTPVSPPNTVTTARQPYVFFHLLGQPPKPSTLHPPMGAAEFVCYSSRRGVDAVWLGQQCGEAARCGDAAGLAIRSNSILESAYPIIRGRIGSEGHGGTTCRRRRYGDRMAIAMSTRRWGDNVAAKRRHQENGDNRGGKSDSSAGEKLCERFFWFRFMFTGWCSCWTTTCIDEI